MEAKERERERERGKNYENELKVHSEVQDECSGKEGTSETEPESI